MIISINDKPCEAHVGDLLLKVAQKHKSHIGCICGGNAICQSCFVYVKEGSECLSPPSIEEKAFISDKLFQEGGRLACRSVIVKEGTLRVLSRAEHLRHLVLGLNVPGFITYAQTIGYNVVNKLPDGAGNLFKRVKDGTVSPGDSLGKIGNGLAYGSLLATTTFMETFPFMQYPVSIISEGAKEVFKGAGNLICNVSGGVLHLPGTCDCGTNKTPVIESVKISVK
ncbi:MAG: (2Fe-2S)-binding protein [Chlorobiaceae bacterium]|jgi:chlorosome envelope protein J|nr:(2Fe-2S)-binding protein [Chlorobiaceae bacterium]